MDKIFKIRLKKGDKVIVRTGSHKGKVGAVLETHPKTNKVTVEGVNIAKKHMKPSTKYPQGGIIEITRPIDVSKVGIVHPTDPTKASKIGYTTDKDGKKQRVYKATGKEIK